MILDHQTALIVGVRFMYGLRLIGPVVIGMSDVSALRFAVLNMIGAAVWAPLVVGAGYLFGHAASRLASDLAGYEAVALLLVVSVALLGGVIHWWRSRARC